MRQHYKTQTKTPLWADFALAIAIGVVLAALLVAWWSA